MTEAVRLLKRDTRHFAKRQMTWFRKEPGIHWITLDESEIPVRVSNPNFEKNRGHFSVPSRSPRLFKAARLIYQPTNTPEG